MNNLTSRLDDLRQREAAHRAESLRLVAALNKAITLIITLAAVGVLTFLCAGQYEQQLKTSALIDQENIATAKGAASWH